MSILIKGMEMPTNCRKCRFDNVGWCLATDRTDNRTRFVKGVTYDSPQEWCPLVPVPPHGRLIDADVLMLKILDYIDEYSDVDENGWHNLKWCAMKETEMAINDAPTIIPAEPFNNLSKPCKDDVDFPICTKASPASLGIYKKAEEGET